LQRRTRARGSGRGRCHAVVLAGGGLRVDIGDQGDQPERQEDHAEDDESDCETDSMAGAGSSRRDTSSDREVLVSLGVGGLAVRIIA
jgi:hypothetical protein